MVMKALGVSPRPRAGSDSSLQFLARYRGLRVKVRTAAARGTHRQFSLRSLTRTNSFGLRTQQEAAISQVVSRELASKAGTTPSATVPWHQAHRRGGERWYRVAGSGMTGFQ